MVYSHFLMLYKYHLSGFGSLWIHFNISKWLFGIIWLSIESRFNSQHNQQSEQQKQLLDNCDFLLVMCVAGGLLVENEEFPEFTQREVTLHILFLIHHTAAQGFLVGLSLQDLLLNCPSLSAHKHTSQLWKTFRPAVCSPVALTHLLSRLKVCSIIVSSRIKSLIHNYPYPSISAYYLKFKDI